MEQQILSIINDFGYLGIIILIALENIFPPIPSEVILTFTGFITLTSDLTILGSTLAATLGAVLGAVALYLIGSWLTPTRLSRFVRSKLGRFLRFKEADIQKAEQFFVKHGAKTVFFGRFVPVVRSLISIPAGMTKMSLSKFAILTTIGTLIWNVILISLGHFAGNAWAQVSATVDSFSTIVTIGLAAIVLIGFVTIYFKRLKKQKSSN